MNEFTEQDRRREGDARRGDTVETDSEARTVAPAGNGFMFSEYDDGHSSDALRDHITQVRDAERRIGEFTGDIPPDLQREAEFRTGDAFIERLPWGSGDPGGLYGFVCRDGRIVIRDATVAAQDHTLLHEGLHKWQLEAAGEFLGPSALNEGIIEHFTREIEPDPEVLYDLLPDGRTHVMVPDLAPEAAYADAAVAISDAPQIYPEGRRLAEELEGLVGRDALLDLCRTADHDAFGALVDHQTREGAWERVRADLSDERDQPDWAAALEELRRRRI